MIKLIKQEKILPRDSLRLHSVTKSIVRTVLTVTSHLWWGFLCQLIETQNPSLFYPKEIQGINDNKRRRIKQTALETDKNSRFQSNWHRIPTTGGNMTVQIVCTIIQRILFQKLIFRTKNQDSDGDSLTQNDSFVERWSLNPPERRN